MKRLHVPQIDARYWTAITLASIFGTNLGDFYAHESGLSLVEGVAVLALIAAVVFAIEYFDNRRQQVYYWLVIIIIRTGATNIADYLAFRVKIPPAPLTLSLVLLLAFFGWRTYRERGQGAAITGGLARTNAAYWLAMLSAGVFGTVLGDICSHAVGQGIASIILGTILVAVLLAGRKRAAHVIALYWLTVAVARTAGTAMGDWLAENEILHIGLPISTLITGCVFVAVLVLWHSNRSKELTTEPLV